MSKPSQRREDVLGWPVDGVAREALEIYLDELSARRPLRPALHGSTLDFRGANLSGLDLIAAVLFGSNLEGVRLIGADLAKAKLNGANLRNADLSGADLTKVDADDCDATGANFRGARLFGAELTSVRLVECDLRDSVLNGGRLLGTDFTGADLRRAGLPGAWFGSERFPTVLRRARVFGCNLYGASGVIVGPVDIGEHEPTLVDGDELVAWFATQDARDVALLP
jgi:uncharacterized protein YjbI with pentapeptide repeats